MSVTPFPQMTRAPIENHDEIVVIEGVISAIAGLVSAQGGTAALGGRDLYAMSPDGRATLLTDMYDAGEVIFGWRDPARGAVRNVVLERLSVAVGAERCACWRAEIYREDAEGGGHLLEGALVETALDAVSRGLLAFANDPHRAAPPPPGAALAAFVLQRS